MNTLCVLNVSTVRTGRRETNGVDEGIDHVLEGVVLALDAVEVVPGERVAGDERREEVVGADDSHDAERKEREAHPVREAETSEPSEQWTRETNKDSWSTS